MDNTKAPTIPLYYEIYLQDLTHDYIDLTLLGVARTREEAANCCRLFKEAISTANTRGVSDKSYRSNCTVMFRPVIKKEG